MRYLQNLMILIVLLSIANSSSGQDCSILSKANDIVPDGLCAPVSVDWKVTYRGVNNAGTSVQIRFDWDDGSAVEDVNAVEISSAEWQASHSHVYPTDGDQCNYRPNVFLVVDGVVCTSSVQEQVVTVWDVDDQNGGLLYVEPPVFPICFGHDGTAQFWDGSRWNCTPPDENDVPNNRKRWIQWIYGTNNTAGNFIDDAQVDGVVESYPYESSVAVTSEPILAPTMPWNRAEPIYVNDSWNVGDEFEITLNNWNYCNPYDKGFAPVTQTGVVRIVDYRNNFV